MKRRILSFLLLVVMVCTSVPIFPVSIEAATELTVTPYPNVEYEYTTETSVGTIRYMAQNRDSEYFNWDYWPTYSFGGYTGGPEIECGTACISMALSYVGVNRTPKMLLEATDGYTDRMWGQQDDASSEAIAISTTGIASAMDNYINGEGKYSPLCIYIVPFSSTSEMHWVLLVGQLGDNKYLALNPWHTSGTDGTFTIQINGSTATYNGTTNPITSVNQWHNPNATPPVVAQSYPSYCAIKVTADTAPVRDMPCSEETDPDVIRLEIASKGDQYQAIGLVKNTKDNLWYKVKTKSGGIGYIYAGNTTYLAKSINDIKASGVTVPTNHTVGQVYSLTGTVASTYNLLTEVSVYIYSGESAEGTLETGASASMNGNYYAFGGSTIDNKTEFNILPVGTHTYVVSAAYKNYYAESAKSLGVNTGTVDLYYATFNVTNTTVSCSHSYSSKVTTAATCASNGVITYTCSSCGASYTEVIAATGNHTYTSNVTTAPGCTTAGVKTYTCGGCSSVYTESIDALGHNYQSEVIGATCSDYEKIRYTCSICKDTYEEYVKDKYSDWSTVKPTGVSESLIESRTEYSSQNKEFTTDSTDTLSGWVLYNTTTEWSEYGSWSEWQDTAVTASDSVKVENRTVYGYYYFKCSSCGAHMHGSNACYTWAGGCGATGTMGWNAVWSTVTWDNAGLKDWYGTGKYYTELNGERVFQWTDNGQPKTQYRYCTRTLETIYHFYRWSDWSEWSTTAVTASDTVNVQTRTVYRCVQAELGDHNWKVDVTVLPTCTEQGYTKYTCSICSESYISDYVASYGHSYDNGYTVYQEPTVSASGLLAGQCTTCGHIEYVTLPALDTVNYTYTLLKSASCVEEGLCRYNWNTTLYGNFAFDVIIEKCAPELGDVDADGKISISDITCLLNYLADTTQTPIGDPDINRDSVVTISDVTELLNILAGNA
ncbi:MAG: dockerin type I repeat-containing protein [Clostridia bacterium]|nr:dockerin type I repeat-containing protein [Clostridia bacterium]